MSRVPLGDVVTFVRGVTFDGGEAHATQRNGTFPILRAGNIGQQLETERDLVWVPATRTSHEQLMRLGDIAICMSSGSPRVVGKSAILDHPFEGSIGAFCGLVRSGPLVHAPFLALWLRSDEFIGWRDSQSRGASIQNLRFSELARLEIDLPPIDEQRRIATELTLELRAAKEAQQRSRERLARTRVLRENVLEAAFDGPETSHHELLGRTGVLQDGDWILTADYSPRGVRLFQVGDIGRERLLAKSNRYISGNRAAELHCTLLRAGDILISRMPDPIGRACVVPDLGYPAITAVDVTIFRPDPFVLDTSYAMQFMNGRSWLQAVAARASGATRARISRLNLEHLEIPLPTLETQRRIAADLRERLATIDAMEVSIRAEHEAIEALPAALLRRAFEDLAA